MRRRPTLAMVVAVAGLSGGCQKETAPPAASNVSEASDSIEKVSQEGPVKATVRLEPKEPRLGDPLVLTLEVRAEAGVSVELPAFGEALGRFSIVDFTPKTTVEADGSSLQIQRYTLDPPMSGRQRIPPLRLEFLDQRGKAPDDAVEARELLTEELSLVIQSVLPETASLADLRPPRPPLGERSQARRAMPWVSGGLAVAALVLAFRWWQRRAVERKKVSAFDRAMGRIRRLESRGLPAAAEVDAWYVELSAVIRQYLEDRYAVRAPELTTEEFLREARRSGELTRSHRELLGRFLEQCDRVKFAAYVPAADESKTAIEVARTFVEETRLRRDVAPVVAEPAA